MGKKWSKSCKLVVLFHGVNEGRLTVELGGEDLNHLNESGIMSLSTFTTFQDECLTVKLSILIENNVRLSICSPSYWHTHKHIPMWWTEVTTTKKLSKWFPVFCLWHVFTDQLQADFLCLQQTWNVGASFLIPGNGKTSDAFMCHPRLAAMFKNSY